MMPIGLLMIEHRLIERMIKLMDSQLRKIKKGNKIDACFIDAAVDFIRIYADKCHHGKEEDILFKSLSEKELSEEHKKMMNELINDHVMGRETVKKLEEAKESYLKGQDGAIKAIILNIETLVNFYPRHIEKEDKHFFIPSMGYFTNSEKDSMLKNMYEFDKNMIHQKYRMVVENHEREN